MAVAMEAIRQQEKQKEKLKTELKHPKRQVGLIQWNIFFSEKGP